MIKSSRFCSFIAILLMLSLPLYSMAEDTKQPSEPDNRLAVGAFLLGAVGVASLGAGFVLALPVIAVILAFEKTPAQN